MNSGDVSGFTRAVMHHPSIDVTKARRPFILLPNVFAGFCVSAYCRFVVLYLVLKHKL